MRILVVPNSGNPRSRETAGEVVRWLEQVGYEPVMTVGDAAACGCEAAGRHPGKLGRLDLAVALGGDGTILKAVHVSGEIAVPVLGVNLGRLGFLTGADASELQDAISEALSEGMRVERRAMLEVSVEAGGSDEGTHRALNEVYVGRGPSDRAVEIAVKVGDVDVYRFLADGVVVATATGSTAYALSAGGPVLAPELRAMVVVPVSPHAVAVRPLVLSEAETVEVWFPNPARSGACVTVDGLTLQCRSHPDRVAVRIGAHDALLVRPHARDVFETFRAKFLGG